MDTVSFSNTEYDVIKLLLVGDSGVGKSCLLTRFTDNKFSFNEVSTVGIDFKERMLEIEGRKTKLQIWDTAGQDRYKSIGPAFFRRAMGILFVYDVTNPETFNNIRKWVISVEEHAPAEAAKMIIGNKSDLPKRVETEKAKGLADDYGFKFLETSAKSAQNVNEAFETLAKEIKVRFGTLPQANPSGSGSLVIKPALDQQTSKCYCW